MSFTKSVIIDGDFSVAREVEGGPMITTDEITKSLSLTRNFCVLRDRYTPQAQGTPDRRFTDAYLVSETPVANQGPHYFFQRNYSQVPRSRTESRPVSWTRPGESAVTLSIATKLPINWDKYGKAPPSTRVVNAQVDYSYANSPNDSQNPFAIIPTLTQITYGGLPVDFVGSVYKFGGFVSLGIGNEARYVIEGLTIPQVLPSTWIQEANVSRWRGSIWQLEVITVNTAV